MKKILLVALALLVSTASFAQFRTAPREVGAPMATKTLDFGQAHDFTVTTINNQSIHLQDWLDSGYYVLLDISATWCSWCWRLHSAHVLEQLYQNYGPNGTDEMRVLWVEGDDETDPSLIYGGTGSQGNWTSGVTYPIANDDNISSLYGVTGYPTVLLICPSGYTQNAYSVCDWNGSQFVTNTSVAAIYGLLNTCPAAGVAPIVEIDGLATVVANSPSTFHASYVSVDEVTSVTWSVDGGATPSTGTGDDFTVTFPSAGNYTVSLSVTNTTGTTTETLNVQAIEWNWDNTMTYDLTETYQNAFGLNGGMIWGAKYPAAFMANRNYLEKVEAYSGYDGHFTLSVYQTTPGADPTNNDMLYQYTYAISAESYNTMMIYDHLQLDNTKDLWIVLSCTDIAYPAAVTEFSGDPNGSLVYIQGGWGPIYDYGADPCTFMIKTTTSATAPALAVGINGPTSGLTNDNMTFTAAGVSTATYSWVIDGGTPATATGTSVTTTFATTGNHTVTLTATLDGETATATHTINIMNCEVSLPWTCGFETTDNLNCWNFIDADGDGYGWVYTSEAFGSGAGHSGSNSFASASYRNDVGVLNPDNYMITPKITIPAEGATIEWWDWGQDQNDFAEHYGVFVSTTGTNAADFTHTVYDGTIAAPKTWVKHSRSLAGFAGQDVYIAFRHYNISNMFWLLIDDISITAGNTASISEVENAHVSLYPNPVTNILHIDAQGIQEVNVLDVNGRTVMTEQNTNRIDMSNLANGVYFVRVITADGVSTQKIAKK